MNCDAILDPMICFLNKSLTEAVYKLETETAKHENCHRAGQEESALKRMWQRRARNGATLVEHGLAREASLRTMVADERIENALLKDKVKLMRKKRRDTVRQVNRELRRGGFALLDELDSSTEEEDVE